MIKGPKGRAGPRSQARRPAVPVAQAVSDGRSVEVAAELAAASPAAVAPSPLLGAHLAQWRSVLACTSATAVVMASCSPALAEDAVAAAANESVQSGEWQEQEWGVPAGLSLTS